MRARPARDMFEGVGKLGTRGSVAVALALLVGTATAQQQPQAASAEAFSAEEQRLLADGRLVRRRATRRRGQLRLIGGSSFQVVDRSVEDTWRVLCDEGSYASWLPSTDDARTVWHRPGERVMRFRHSVGLVSAQYHLRLTYDHDQHDLAFRLDSQRPNDLRAAWGFLRVQPFEDDTGRSLVSYGVMADVGGGVIGGMFRDQIHDSLLRVPASIRRYVHGH